MSVIQGKKLMTADEFFDFVHRPENRDRRFELERGEVVELSLPGERHGYVCVNVGRILMNFAFQRRKGYACCNDTGLILERDPDTVRGPDVMFYDLLRRYGDLNTKWSAQPPTLVVEVLSPNDRWSKVSRRIAQYLSRGSALVWIVDPEDQSVTVYRAGELPQVFEGTDELTGNNVLPDFRCRVADFFYLPGEEETPAAPAN
jgi:Uma2 family endonuclease